MLCSFFMPMTFTSNYKTICHRRRPRLKPQFFAGKFAPNCLCVIIDESRCCLLGLPLTFPWYVYVLVILSMVDFEPGLFGLSKKTSVGISCCTLGSMCQPRMPQNKIFNPYDVTYNVTCPVKFQIPQLRPVTQLNCFIFKVFGQLPAKMLINLL